MNNRLPTMLLLLVALVLGACSSTLVKDTEGFIDVDGGRIWYRVNGPTSRKTPLLLIHGGPGFSSYYLDRLQALSDERPVIFYDQLGGGRSDKPDDVKLWRVERFVDEVDKVRKALGLKEVHILGHSWGATILADYMLTKPSGVKSLIIGGPLLSASRWTADAHRLVKTLPDAMQQAIAEAEATQNFDSDGYKAADDEYLDRYVCRVQPWPEELSKTFEMINEQIYNTMWGPSEFGISGTLKNFERGEALSWLKIPVLFTVGRYDEATPESAEYFRGQIPGAKIKVFEHSAHVTMLEEPEAYIQTLRDYLRDVEAD